jgi:exodeoxyribonuclease VII large subunit
MQVSALEHLSPLSTLTRGYSITHLENEVLKSTIQVKINQTLITQLPDGRLYSVVQKIETT